MNWPFSRPPLRRSISLHTSTKQQQFKWVGGSWGGGRESPESQGAEDSLSLCALTQQISSQRSYCEPSRAHQSSASVLLRKTRDVGLNRCTQNISKFRLLQVELQMKAPKPAVPLTTSRSNSACVYSSLFYLLFRWWMLILNMTRIK